MTEPRYLINGEEYFPTPAGVIRISDLVLSKGYYRSPRIRYYSVVDENDWSVVLSRLVENTISPHRDKYTADFAACNSLAGEYVLLAGAENACSVSLGKGVLIGEVELETTKASLDTLSIHPLENGEVIVVSCRKIAKFDGQGRLAGALDTTWIINRVQSVEPGGVRVLHDGFRNGEFVQVDEWLRFTDGSPF